MKRTIGVLALILGVLATAAAWHGRVSAQARQPAQDPDVLPALLTEVRGLRAAMEQMASAGPRVQLALGRLQLQEQRVNNLARRLDEVRAGLLESQQQYQRSQQELAHFDETPLDQLPIGLQAAPQQKEIRTHMNVELARAAADVQRLTAEESGVSAELAAEQGRWTDLNQRMEELERTLTRK